MSIGLPVVATSIAGEGMQLADGEEFLLADNIESFATSVVTLARMKICGIN